MSITQDILNKRRRVQETINKEVSTPQKKKRSRKQKNETVIDNLFPDDILDAIDNKSNKAINFKNSTKTNTGSLKRINKELSIRKQGSKIISIEELSKLLDSGSVTWIGFDLITGSPYDCVVFAKEKQCFRISKETAETYSRMVLNNPGKCVVFRFDKEKLPKGKISDLRLTKAIKSVTPMDDDVVVVCNEDDNKAWRVLLCEMMDEKSEEMKKSVVSKKFSRETSEDDSLETKTTQSNPRKSDLQIKDSIHSPLTRKLLTTQAVSAYPIEAQALKESIERYNINGIYSNYYIDPDKHVLVRKRDFINIKDLEREEKTPAHLRVEKVILDRNKKYPLHENTKYPIGDLDKDVIDSELSRKIDMLFDGLYREIRSVRSKAMELIRDSIKPKSIPDMMDKTKHPKKKLLIVDRLAIIPENSTSKNDKSDVKANEPEKPKRFLKSTNRHARVGTLLLCKCGKEFVKKNSKQIYCCTECSVDEIIKKGK